MKNKVAILILVAAILCFSDSCNFLQRNRNNSQQPKLATSTIQDSAGRFAGDSIYIVKKYEARLFSLNLLLGSLGKDTTYSENRVFRTKGDKYYKANYHYWKTDSIEVILRQDFNPPYKCVNLYDYYYAHLYSEIYNDEVFKAVHIGYRFDLDNYHYTISLNDSNEEFDTDREVNALLAKYHIKRIDECREWSMAYDAAHLQAHLDSMARVQPSGK